MQPDLISVISGLVGAVIGGMCTLFAVRMQENRTKRSELLMILVDQRVRLRRGKIKDLTALTSDDHLSVLKAYIDLRSALFFPDQRDELDRVWRDYKGNSDDYLPLYHTHTVSYPSERSIEVTSHHPSYEESCARIDKFIAFLNRTNG